MHDNYERIAEQVLGRVQQRVRGQAEVFISDSQEMKVDVAEKKVENMLVAQERGLGLRVIAGQRLGYAFTSDLSNFALERVVEQAIYNAKESEPDSGWELPLPSGGYPVMKLYDDETFAVSVDEKIELARNIEESARAFDARVRITERSVYQEAKYRVSIFNSLGLNGSFLGSYCGGYAVVVGQENGDSQTGFGMQYDLKYKELNAQKIGREAAEKAVRMLGAQKIASAHLPVVLDPYTVTSFFSVLQTAFSAEAVMKGKSFFEGQEQKQVANPQVTIIDDGAMPYKLGSMPFDGEGMTTRQTVLIKDGWLQGFLHSNYTAKKFGVSSTGNGVRGSFKSTPEVGITNFYISEGTSTKEQIIKEITKGLYITDVMGMHTANPVSGDFSLGVSGLLIENGELTRPVKGIAVAGNLKELLMDIDAVGNQVVFYVTKGAPVLRIKALSISGD